MVPDLLLIHGTVHILLINLLGLVCVHVLRIRVRIHWHLLSWLPSLIRWRHAPRISTRIHLLSIHLRSVARILNVRGIAVARIRLVWRIAIILCFEIMRRPIILAMPLVVIMLPDAVNSFKLFPEITVDLGAGEAFSK